MSDPSSALHYTVVTAWGSVCLTATARGLASVRLFDPVVPQAAAAETVAPSADLADWTVRLQAYFAGEMIDLSVIPLDESRLSEIDRAIYAALRRVQRGQTVSYGELARRIDKPGAARAVGVAMARNPWPIVVPCHRVLASDGTLGGFSAPGGVATKRRLLALEGVDLDRGAPLLPGLFD